MNAPAPGVNGPVEPSADLREMARHLRQMYVALVEQGFTVTEAMTIIATVISASAPEAGA